MWWRGIFLGMFDVRLMIFDLTVVGGRYWTKLGWLVLVWQCLVGWFWHGLLGNPIGVDNIEFGMRNLECGRG